MKNRKKAGFTLVELMVVAAIIAILAAIIIPLLASNKDSAIASEAANICGAVATESKAYFARTGNWPTKPQIPATTSQDIDRARYFSWGEVALTGTDASDWTVTVAGGATHFTDGLLHTLTLNAGDPEWTGDMSDTGADAQGWVGNN